MAFCGFCSFCVVDVADLVEELELLLGVGGAWISARLAWTTASQSFCLRLQVDDGEQRRRGACASISSAFSNMLSAFLRSPSFSLMVPSR